MDQTIFNESQQEEKNVATTLIAAIECDDVATVRQLPVKIIQDTMTMLDKSSVPLLHLAVYASAVCVVEYLLTVPGIDVNKKAPSKDPSVQTSAFVIAVSILVEKGEGNVTNDETELARILARDQRVNLDAIVTIDKFILMPLVQVVLALCKPGHNSLLIAMVRNPSIDINLPEMVPAGGDSKTTKIPFFIHAMQIGREDLFYEMVSRADLIMSYTDCGHNAMHYAVHNNLRFAAMKLLKVMDSEDINAASDNGQRFYNMCKTSSISKFPQFIRPFIDSPKVILDGNMVYSVIKMMVDDGKKENVRGRSAAELKKQRRAWIDLLAALMGNPRCTMENIDEETMHMAITCTLEWHNDSLFMKLITWNRLDRRQRRAPTDTDGILMWSFIDDAIIVPIGCGNRLKLDVFKEMMKFAEIRDQIASFGEFGIFPNGYVMNLLHVAVQENRADVLLQLLATSTDDCLNARIVRRTDLWNKKKKKNKGYTCLELAKEMEYPLCVKVITTFRNFAKEKIKETEHGHVFNCC